MDCIFCKIIKGEIPSKKVYEDDNFLAFLDISPVNLGHTLIIPKTHYENFLETPDKIIAELFIVVKKVAKTVKMATVADGINIGINNGKAAGQIIFHTHIHIIPRFKDDNFTNWPNKKYKEGEIDEVGEKIRKYLKAGG